MKNTDRNKKGFTLIELSIVLVIIGLITGSVFAGQALIRQSQISSAVTDFQKYTQAAVNFQQKYGALPGDFASAVSYWGGGGGACPATNASPLSGTLTCNGNGNGQIETNATLPVANNDEALLFWQQLVSAQFISGYYTGSPGSGGTADHAIGTNAPASRIDGAGFGVVWVGVTSGNTNYFDNNYGHVMILGGYSANYLPVSPALTTSEASNLDSKFDDGIPGTGNILGWKPAGGGYNPSCTSSSTAYNTAAGGYLCSVIFITGF